METKKKNVGKNPSDDCLHPTCKDSKQPWFVIRFQIKLFAEFVIVLVRMFTFPAAEVLVNTGQQLKETHVKPVDAVHLIKWK